MHLELLRGDILFHLERYAEARQAYSLASSMCPVRFAPLEGLMNVYEQQGDLEKLHDVAYEIANKPVKIPSHEIDRIKFKAQSFISSGTPKCH